jgi:hypothetical protein
MKGCVPPLPSQNLDTRLFESSIAPTNRRRPPHCSTRAHSSYTSLARTLSPARICSSCMYTEALL